MCSSAGVTGVNSHPELLRELACVTLRDTVSFVTINRLPACIAEIKLIPTTQFEVSSEKRLETNLLLKRNSGQLKINKADKKAISFFQGRSKDSNVRF